MLIQWIGHDVPEVYVERDENSPLPLGHLTQVRVLDDREPLAPGRGGLVARVSERCGDAFGKVPRSRTRPRGGPWRRERPPL